MKLSVAIMMHPSRKHLLPYLYDKLGDDVPVAFDEGKGIWETRERATRAYDPKADFHVVIQDDAIIGNDFYNRAIKELEKYPQHAHSFYYGTRNRDSWRKMNEDAIVKGGYLGGWYHWGVAICLPVKIIDKCMDFCSRMKTLPNNDDTRIANFIRDKKMKVWYPVPSLVDHRTDEPSLMENHEGPHQRKALRFVGE